MNKYDLSKVSREALEAYVSDALGVKGSNPSTGFKSGERVLAEAEVLLRTRAEVDAEIVEAVRAYHRYVVGIHVGIHVGHDAQVNFNGAFEWKNKDSVSIARLLSDLVKENTEG